MSVQPTLSVERRSIDFVPRNERHGHVRSLFTLWFGANMQVTTIAAGSITVAVGVPLPWALLAIVLGNVIGAVFMALHSAQGPLLGIPRMIQSRAQFGYRGAVLPLVLVVLMYIGYFASSAVLTAEALSSWILGIFVSGGLYLLLMRLAPIRRGHDARNGDAPVGEIGESPARPADALEDEVAEA